MEKQRRIIRWLLGFFIGSLLVSGLTALPLDPELCFLLRWFSPGSGIHHWLLKVLVAYRTVNASYPFLFYGYDWLVFAHLVLAILFLGPYRDPVKNIWVIQFGLITCILVFPLAFLAGPLRGIPFGWTLIDASFGFFGAIPLWISYRKTLKLASFLTHSHHSTL